MLKTGNYAIILVHEGVTGASAENCRHHGEMPGILEIVRLIRNVILLCMIVQ